jgi:hypothetical protein
MSSIISGKAVFATTWLQRALLVLVAASLSGCFDGGSGDDGGTAAPVTDQPTSNQPPEVSGTPAATATTGQMYSFKPDAIDADRDFLEYTITNKPAWATFDDESGLLSGVPTDANVGESDDITITVTDGKDTRSIGPFKIRVNRPGQSSSTNQAPTISGNPPTSVVVENPYRFEPQALDADGDTLRYSISNRPSWATFSSTTGVLSGTPHTANVGTYSNIVISVNDGTVTTLLPSFSIQVQGPNNNAPVISGTPATSVQAGVTYTFAPSASDPDGDTSLVYSILNQPRWANFSTASGRLSGTPSSTDVGTYSNITIRVSDGRLTTSLPAFTITVTAAPVANRAPTITGSPATTASVGSAYAFTPSASDPDGGTLGFTIQNRPSWAAFDTATGRLSGTPTAAGTFSNIVIAVTDGRLTASLPAFTITASASAPRISGTPVTTASVGAAYNFQPTASDPNGDTLTFSIQNSPSWATFSTSTGRLSGTPTSANAGTFSNIIISVSDGTNRVSLPAFAITVAQATNGSATLAWTPPTQNTDGSSLTNLSGYRVVYGRSSTSLDQIVQITNAGASAYTITGLSSGTWYFAVKAYNTAGAESNVSNVGSKTIP